VIRAIDMPAMYLAGEYRELFYQCALLRFEEARDLSPELISEALERAALMFGSGTLRPVVVFHVPHAYFRASHSAIDTARTPPIIGPNGL
jgi:hypothetical protein